MLSRSLKVIEADNDLNTHVVDANTSFRNCKLPICIKQYVEIIPFPVAIKKLLGGELIMVED